ncbi:MULTISPECIES: prohibitin family protein [Agrobacterium]|uniref:Regulator of protease activity HflC (Stomatin/prohibitin superfamily) n=2 Tax=Agrobacterium tumefaciens complex TaxID=1183400 RepID=A0AAW8M3T2_AGRTU|nr:MULTISPECIES: prohibitin family protein [Agrobacterium]MCP2138053.1 regulator of protease activity HflC (stomatin/prohibitin superfamily) [Rhizobium sp. SLBN-94]KAB0459106.1 prohibitin family protein [Agrobacterium tumefaciens]MBB4320727.1 regulator of protease activity HflC (stomatin/prohibitin superfamily) [Agrobacterium radiobacter]MBB4337391.1 regulator of protease activity HflC (stomatin/prohibitin superfamily) [Agrobacterium radiobacter]MBB4409183.1 regulator of protease activity HflC
MRVLPVIPSIIFGIVAIAILSIVFGSWYTIDQGERGVILRYGAIAGTAEPGLGFKLPVIDTVVRISVQSKAAVYDAMEAYSRDQQPATVKLSVNYRIPVDRVAAVYEQYGSEAGLLGRLIERRVFEETKTVFGRFNAVTAIQERGRLNQEIAMAIQEGVQGPVTIESVQIENIDFSDSYEASIEQRMLAEVEVQKLRQNAEREKVQAEITVTQANASADARRADAQAQADAVRLQAQADAEAIRLRGDAEALAIKARGDALRNNPGLVSLTQAERWDGRLPTTMLPNGALPMIDLRNPGLPDVEQSEGQ